MNALIDCANILEKTDCITSTKDESMFVSGHDTILTFVNENCDPLVKVDIDCLLDEYNATPPYDFKRCDFIVQHKNTNYYVELKTGNPDGACNQIASAIKNLNKCFDCKKCKVIKAIIVVFFPSGIPFIAAFHKEFEAEFKKSDLMQYVRDDICEAPKIIIAPDATYPLS